MKDFDMEDGTHLRIRYDVDESDGGASYRRMAALRAKTDGDPQLKGRAWCKETTRKIGGDWIKCGLTFSSLKTGTNYSLRGHLSVLADSSTQMENQT